MTRRADFSKRTVEKVIEAIDEDKKEEAKSLAQEIWEETRPVHDQYGDLLSSLLTYISKRLGEEAVEDAFRYMAEEMWKPVLLGMKGEDTDSFVHMVTFFLRTHGFEFSCDEDDEKYVFTLRYCPSGGRMMKEGKNDDSDRHSYRFGMTQRAYPWSFNQRGISYYCCHCALWMDILPREWGWDVIETQFGKQFDEKGNPIDDPCRMVIYKNPRA